MLRLIPYTLLSLLLLPLSLNEMKKILGKQIINKETFKIFCLFFPIETYLMRSSGSHCKTNRAPETTDNGRGLRTMTT
jgi:hypothetical protein